VKAEEFRVAIDRESNPQKDAYVRQVHLNAVILVGHVTGSYGASQMALAQECVGAMFALDPDGARMLVKTWCDELHGGEKDLAAENEALRRFAAAEEVIRAGRKS
jgi:hypothetical protein